MNLSWLVSRLISSMLNNILCGVGVFFFGLVCIMCVISIVIFIVISIYIIINGIGLILFIIVLFLVLGFFVWF